MLRSYTVLPSSVSSFVSHLTAMFTQVWLRSADVRILRQLVAVHEGIEAMRWLMEERDALTGSLSSLVGHGTPMSPFR